MAFALNAAEIQPLNDEFSPLPANTYNVKITEIAEKPTQSNGLMIVFTMEVLDGKYKGRKLWNNFNVVNDNPKAVDIARRGIATVCHLLGDLDFRTERYGAYYNKPFAVKVGLKTENDQNGQAVERNRINAYLAYQAPGVGLVPAPVAAPRPAAPAPVTPPPQFAQVPPPVAPAPAPVPFPNPAPVPFPNPAPVVAAPPVAPQPMVPPVTPAPAPVATPPVFQAPVAPVPPVAPTAPVAQPVAAPVAQEAPSGDIPSWAQS